LHISGTNTTTAIHVSGDQAIFALFDVDAAATDGLKVMVDDGITLTTGINIIRSGTTGIVTTGIDLASGCATGLDIGISTTAIAITGASTTGISFTAGSGTMLNANAAAAAASTRGIFIGEDSNSAQSGIPLLGASWATAQGNAFYCDDDGVALVGYTEAFTVRMLTTAAVTTGDVSTVAIHPDLYLNASYTGSGGLSSIWGNTTIASGKTIDTSAGLGDVGGATFGIDINGVLAANSHACGVSVGVGGSGTKTGILCGYRIRGATGTVDWDGILSIEDGDGSWTSMTQAAASNTATMTNSPKTGDPAYWLKIYIAQTAYYFPVWTA
jgi:hypothetical protein